MELFGITDREFRGAERFYDTVVCGRLSDEWMGITEEELEPEESEQEEDDDENA